MVGFRVGTLRKQGGSNIRPQNMTILVENPPPLPPNKKKKKKEYLLLWETPHVAQTQLVQNDVGAEVYSWHTAPPNLAIQPIVKEYMGFVCQDVP